MKSIRQFVGGIVAFAAVTLLLGCGDPKGASPKAGTNKPTPQAAQDTKADHPAHGAGPHGGTVADWGGGKYHIEFTVDHGKQEATVYILGSDEKTATAIKTKDQQLSATIKSVKTKDSFQVALKASPQMGDAEGKASRFVGKHEKLGIEQEFEGTITGEADGTPYFGEFKEEPEGRKKK
jgi:hypothetical protein